ncbi:MAG: hypothetical protein R3246_06980 [Acidimicrobiia bacterium]|nr:hypothetical protein [Acidimicrobiia bacterium]
MRICRAFAVVLLVLAACTSTAGPTTVDSSTLQESEVTVATPVSSTTTTSLAAAGPVDFCGRGLVWEPGETYVAPCFLVPIAFEPTEDGWASTGGRTDLVRARWREPAEDGLVVRVALFPLGSSDSPQGVMDRIAQHELISEISDRTEAVVAGYSALVADVEGAPEPGGELVSPDGSACTPEHRSVWFPATSFGHTLLELLTIGGGSEVVGVGACHVARIWVVDVDGVSITIVGGTGDPERHPEALAKIDELFGFMTFDTTSG